MIAGIQESREIENWLNLAGETSSKGAFAIYYFNIVRVKTIL